MKFIAEASICWIIGLDINFFRNEVREIRFDRYTLDFLVHCRSSLNKMLHNLQL